MRAYDVITKKKQGEALTREEINFFVSEYTSGSIPDYQASALLMAICLKGMNDDETLFLTEAISSSGDFVDLSAFGHLTADKHSTGGVGDKTTLVVAPLAAALGCTVAKMSGRGLGHTGGTVDKLEAFPGYNVSIPNEQFIKQIRDIGVAVISQTGNLAPADKKIYALRDVTATVDSIPLITSSIMGKKLASGAHNIVLDVKCGSGAFVKNEDEAEILARKMVEIGKMAGRNVAAFITDMNTPLGFAVGNSLEVKEAIETLRGNGPSDLTEISVSLAAMMAHLTLGLAYESALDEAKKKLADGSALTKFKEWISAQGGDTTFIDSPEKFKDSSYKYEIKATRDGYIAKINTELIGVAASEVGAGRKTKDDVIDLSAGIILRKKTGELVKRGDVLTTLYTNDEKSISGAEKVYLSALSFSDSEVKTPPLIYKTVT